MLDWKVFSKGLAYAYLYASQEGTGESRKWKELTLTFIRRARPVKLLRTLEKLDFTVEKKEEGVYHISNKTAFKVQIIVLREVSFDKHPWLAALASDLNIEEIKKLFCRERELMNREDMDNAEAVMEVVARANKKVFGQIGDDVIMGEALMELVKPQIDALIAEEIAKKDAEKEAEIARKEAEKAEEIAKKDAEISKLKEQIRKLQENAV